MRAGFVASEGVRRLSDDGSRTPSTPVVMVVTDRRLCFVTPGGEPLDGGSLEYGEVATIDIERDGTDCLVVTATDGTDWRFPLPDEDPAATAAVGSHLRWVGAIRRRLLRVRNDVELAAGQIREHVDAMEWDAAREAYQRARDDLDDLITAVQLTAPIDDCVLAPELTDVERTLEEAHVRLSIERAHSELELAMYHVQNEEFGRAKEVLCHVQEHYEWARGQRAAVERADAFLFGTQRELQEEVESLGWELETVAAEPVRLANEARVHAQEAAEPTTALEHWEDALERYGTLLTLDRKFGGPRFAENRERIQHERKAAAEHAIDIASELARTHWNEGAERQQSGETNVALQYCSTARDHLERAHDLALEFDPGRALEFAPRLETMTETIATLQQTVETADDGGAKVDDETISDEMDTDAGGEADTDASDGTDVDSSDGTDTDASGEAGTETSRKRDDLPSVDDLLGMDTHHEITLEFDGFDVQPADGGRSSSESVNGTSAAEESAEDEDSERTDGGVPGSKSDEDESTELASEPTSSGAE